jgi:hypothetical protein
VNRTRNLLIWSQTRYHCATDPGDTTSQLLIDTYVNDCDAASGQKKIWNECKKRKIGVGTDALVVGT